jgi:PAS domain S-box-containing protein
VASDYTGLGNTGETVIGVKNNEGNVLFINNLRNESAKISNLDTSNRSIIRALNGTESTFTDTIDYRDIKVFSATRYIDDTKWGIVVKQDRSEVLAPVYLAETAILAIFLLIWISIFVLIKWIIKMVFGPLKKIEDGINIIKNGDLDHRFNFTDKNEMSRLANSFNKMTDNLQESRKSVDHRVYTQTKDIINQSEKLQNQQSAVLNILEDIEDEKFKAEQLADDLIKFQMAVEGASDHIVITNPDGVIIFANHGAEIISGFSKSEMIGKKAGSSELWGGQMSDDIYKKFWQTIKIDKKPYSGIFDNKKKSGKLYEAAATVAPIVNDANEVIYFVGIERDVTKEKEIDKAKTEFVSLASHQLRTPLSAINWYTEMLLDGDAGEISKQQKMYLDEIYRGNQRMVELVNSLLNVSRLDLGTFEIKPQLIELAPVIDDIINEMKHTLLDKKQKIVNKIHDDFPKISVDPKLIRVIIQNLISNAIKYSPINGIITVTVSYHPKNINSAYEINIADSGYGIPSNQKDLIFTKLFRADNIREMDTEGTGLGLYIVKSILDEAGGGISFNSVENKGTTFTVTLPISGMKQKSGNKTIE